MIACHDIKTRQVYCCVVWLFLLCFFFCFGGWGCSRLQGKKGDLDKAYRVDKDLAAAEAKRLIAMEKRQEDDAFLLSREYDDDYDDQVLQQYR